VGTVHGDLSPNQFLHLEGVYKLNDFHISMFLREDDNQHICLDRMGFSSGNYIIHAPEEKDRSLVDLTKADVYVMGHVMFNLYAKTWLYEGIMEPEALDMLYAGTHTAFPPNLDTTIPANAAMQSAILQCWTHDPKERPSARSVRDYLLQELSSILGQPILPGDPILKVPVDPLPRDHRYTGTSMDEANVGNPRRPRKVHFNNH
jgi:Protein tyrosine and serine/threonine kinase